VPKRVDHDERRSAIADGLLRLAARDGVHAVTMRAVADEADVSTRLVQYYFGTKAELLFFAMQKLAQQLGVRLQRQLGAESLGPRRRIEALFFAALPVDEESRTFHLVYTAYAALAMTDPELAEQPFIVGPTQLEQQVADWLAEAQRSGELPAALDVTAEAAILMALSAGLGTSLLLEQRSIAAARHALQYHFDRLFSTSAPS
jgi:AcrR family transcriptional regulator